MTANSNGSDLREHHPGEVRPATDSTSIITRPTDMCQQAVRWQVLVSRYGSTDLEGYDATLIGLATKIDHALTRFDAAAPGAERDAVSIDIGKLIESLADAPPPGPLDCLQPDDVEWVVEVECHPDLVVRRVLETLPTADATILRTYLSGASDLARARLEAAIQSVAGGVVSRDVTSLWLPSRAAIERGIALEDLATRLATEALPMATMAAVCAAERAPDLDWVSTLAVTVEAAALSVETRSPTWGASLSSDARSVATVAAYVYTTIVEAGVEHAIEIEELLAEQIIAERSWDPDTVSAEAARAAVDVVRSRGVSITEAMQDAALTRRELMRGILTMMREAELARMQPDLDRAYRRDASKTAKSARKAARKAQRDARRRGRGA